MKHLARLLLVAFVTTATFATAALAQGAPKPDPRVGLRGGTQAANGAVTPAAQAAWNIRLIANAMPPAPFMGQTNSDLAFTGNYVIQGNYAGPLVWDISNPAKPVLTKTDLCPASQNDVSVYKHLMIMSNESNSGRLDCGGGGIQDTVSAERLRGIRIFDIRDINNPKYVANVQTCRGSHTHTIVTDPENPDTFYIYISGQAGVRSPNELAGCSDRPLSEDPKSSLFQIEVIKVPVASPEKAAIIGSARIFNDLAAPPVHGPGTDDLLEIEAARRAGAFIAVVGSEAIVLPPQFVAPMLDSVVKARNGTGSPTAADSAAFRAYLPKLIASLVGGGETPSGPDQCHDITVYPAIGLAGGACGGYGLLLDIRNPANPVRIGAVADSNFSYWHSATFNNDGTTLLFSDEWGGGGAPKCRATDKPEWGANAIFALKDGKLTFKSYYKIPAAQTALENCVAHNGSLIPIPGRDVMVQAWYQGGISVFDFTDAAKPVEIAYFDRGPVDSTRFTMGGSWSVYWYNGVIVSSEIARGLDIFELVPSGYLTQNEIDAAKTVRFEQFNAQNQPKFTWPATFSLARAYVDQLERTKGFKASMIATTRTELARAEKLSPSLRKQALIALAAHLNRDAPAAPEHEKVHKLATIVAELK